MSAGTEAAPAIAPVRSRAAERPLGFRLAAALQRLAATALLEVRLNLTVPAPWVIGLILAALGYLTVRTSPDTSSFPLAWALSRQVAPLAGALLLFLTANLANRPHRYEVMELLDSKLVGSEELILGRWVGMAASLAAPLGLMFLATMVGQVIHSRHAILPLAYALSLARMLPAILFLTTLSFSLAALTRVLHLGAGLAAILWFALYSGQEYYPTVLRMELTQNAPVLLGITATLLLAMLLGYRGRRRAKNALATRALAVLTGLAALSSGIYASWAYLALPGKQTAVATWKRLPKGRLDAKNPVPNFAWLDQSGRRVSLWALHGKPALVVFFSPKDGGLLPMLRRLAAVRAQFAGRLSVAPVCLSEDTGIAPQAVWCAGADLPVVTDWGGTAGDGFDERKPSSAIAWKLGITSTPQAKLLGPDGREMKAELPLDEPGFDDLKARLKAAADGSLSGEAESPSRGDAEARP